MGESEDHKDAFAEDMLPRFVVVSASPTLAASLQSALRLNPKLQVVASESPVDACAQLDPDLLIVEVTSKTERATRELMDARPRAAVILIGSPEVPPSPDPRLRVLASSASVADVARESEHLLRGQAPPRLTAARPSHRSAPVQVLPRASEPPPSLHSRPAPLLPSSLPPSSRPSGRFASAPTGQATDALSDETPFSPTEYSQELQRILGDAERRVAAGVPSRPLSSPHGPVTPSFPARPIAGEELSQELREALILPIGEPEPALPMPRKPGAHVTSRESSGGSQLPTMVLDADEALGEELPGMSAAGPELTLQRRLGLPPSQVTRELRDPSTTGLPAPDTSASHPEAATARPPPPGLERYRGGSSTEEGDETGPDLPAVPPAPGVPRGEWIGRVLGKRSPDDELELESDDHEAFTPPPPNERRRPAVARSASRRPRPSGRAPSGRDAIPTLPPRQGARSRPSTPPNARMSASSSLLRSDSEAAPPTSARSRALVSDEPAARSGEPAVQLARAIRDRFTGTLTCESSVGMRRLVMRDGDFVIAASAVASESLLGLLLLRGAISSDVQARLGHRLPSFGRHAGAALVAGGHLAQDQLWPMLRAHAEFIIDKVLGARDAVATFEDVIPDRLRAEPSVFGGATGAEVFVEACRRVVEPEHALAALGGGRAQCREGQGSSLLDECALSRTSLADLEIALRYPLQAAASRFSDPESACVLYALMQLGALRVELPTESTVATAERRGADALDEDALREAIRLRRALVDEGDYFTLLGVPHDATGYLIRNAYLELRKRFAEEALTHATLDLSEDVYLIREVLDEAYGILANPDKRERYRRAIESHP